MRLPQRDVAQTPRKPMLQQLKANLILVIGFVALLWAVAAANFVTEHDLNTWGILPRTLTGLRGIPFSPFLHGGLGHLAVNTAPFFVLGGLVALQGRRVFLSVSLIVVVCGGSAVWLFGRAAYHIGASGLIFGFFGYLIARGWYERSIQSILIALVTLFFYGSLVWGVLPTSDFISWEGHLFGLLAGILAARIQGARKEEKPASTPSP